MIPCDQAIVPNESTPLRGNASTTDQSQRKKRIVTLIGVIAAAAVAAGVWVSTSGRTATTTVTPAVVEKPGADASAATDESKLFCGLANHESGYIKLPNKKDDHYFYWFYESRSSPETDPLVIWLTGGPGCSSMMALLAENGPCHVKPDLTTELNAYSWNSNANVIWLDQPSNVGFSYGTTLDLDKDETDVQDNIYWFLHGFLDKHPELEGRDLYITGESYAGHYVPAAAHKIWQENKAVKAANATIRINLKGIAIGNGLTNPMIQTQHSLDMVDNAYNITLMSEEEYASAKAKLPECMALLKEALDVNDLEKSMEKLAPCQDVLGGPAAKAHRNPYDIRQPCDVGADATKCYDFTYISEYLNSPLVKKHLNISSEHDKQWVECSVDVGTRFVLSGDVFANYESYVADLLNDGDIRVLLYAGDADTVCNWSGNKAWATALEWAHKHEFNAAEDRPFLTSNGAVNAGVVKNYGHQFTFLRVFNSGHMVPMDQPAIALEMINKFIQNQDL